MANLAENMRFLERKRNMHVAGSLTKSINLLSNELIQGVADVSEYLPDLAPGADPEQDDKNMKEMLTSIRKEETPRLQLPCGKWQPVLEFIREALDDGSPYGNICQVLLRSGKYKGLEELF